MKLTNARLCLDCDEVHDEHQCPMCTSESFAFIKRWVPTPERAPAPVATPTRDEKTITYRALLGVDSKPTITKRLLRSGAVGLTVLGAAGWLLRKNAADKRKKDPDQ